MDIYFISNKIQIIITMLLNEIKCAHDWHKVQISKKKQN